MYPCGVTRQDPRGCDAQRSAPSAKGDSSVFLVSSHAGGSGALNRKYKERASEGEGIKEEGGSSLLELKAAYSPKPQLLTHPCLLVV